MLLWLVAGSGVSPSPAWSRQADVGAVDSSLVEVAAPIRGTARVSAGVSAGPDTEGLRDGIGADGDVEWGAGDLLFFVGLSPVVARQGAGAQDPEPVPTTFYGEVHVRWSPGRLFGSNELAGGPVNDVMLVQEVDLGTFGLAHLHGVGLDLSLGPAGSARANLYVRDDVSMPGATWQVLVGLSRSLPVSPKVGVAAFLDVFGREGTRDGGFSAYAQALADVGRLVAASPSRLQVGMTASMAGSAFVGSTGAVGAMVRWRL